MGEETKFPYPENFFDSALPKGVLSPSGINLYAGCPRQYYYSYVLGMRQPPGIAMTKGKAIHTGAEMTHLHTIANGAPLGYAEAMACVADAFDAEAEHLTEKDKNNPELPLGVVKDNALDNFSVFYKEAIPHISPVAAEKPVAFKVGSVPVRGIIDLIDKCKGQRDTNSAADKPLPGIEEVSDLKTAKKTWPDQRVEFERQLTLYAIAENTENVRVDLLLDQKRGCTYTARRAVRSTHEKNILIEDVEAIADAIKKGVFPRCNPTDWVCTPKWCGYYTLCRGPK